MKSKVQMAWEVSREAEEEFLKVLKKISCGEMGYDEEELALDLEELFKMIRGAEYRRGKRDALLNLNGKEKKE